jgi:DNA-binding NarL/FixJ family response regulator
MAAIKAGASGYVLKSASRAETVEAIKEVLSGGSFLSGRVARLILNEIKSASTVGGEHSPFPLTDRETEVLQQLDKGYSYKRIAGTLGISYHTVNNHIRKIYKKMRVNSRAEATALRRGPPRNNRGRG